MKKIDTFQTFARGAKSLVAILLVMLMAVGSLFAQTQTTYTHDITSKTWTSLGTQSLSGVNWTLTGIGSTKFNYDSQYGRGQQFGQGSEPFASLSLSTNEIPGTISSITVNTSGASNVVATFRVKVGDTYFTCNDVDSINLTSNATEYTFVGSSEGEITFEWEQTSSKALYLRSITVVYEESTPTVIEPTWVSCNQVGIFNTQVDGLVPTCSTVGDSTVYHFSYTDAFTQYPFQTPNQDWGADGNVIYVDVAVSRPSEEITGVEVSFGPGTEHIVTFGDVLDPNNGTLGADRYAALRYFRVATVVDGQAVGNETEFRKTATYKWYIGEELVAIQKLHVVVDAAPVPEPFVPETTWVNCDQVGIFNTQVDGLVPTCSTVGDSTVYHFSYTDAFTQYPFQTPNQDWGADGNVIYVDVAVSRPSEEITGVEVSFGPGTEHIVTFGDVLDPNNGTLGADRYAALRYFRVATVVDGQAVGNETEFRKTATYKWYIGEELVAIQKLHVVVDAAPVTPAIDTWVSCEQVDVFNTQVTGLVPTCATVGDSTVFHFAYNEEFAGFPAQTPNQEMGGNPSKVYVDVMVKRPNADITGVKVSYGPNHEEIINFTEVTDPNNGTLGNPYNAILCYFPVATVNADGSVTGNTVDRNWTIDVEWCVGTEVVATQYLNVLIDAAPTPVLPYDTVAELPYAYNFDEGNDPYFMFNNGEAVNKWHVGQAQGFDNNKLYISSNNGITNKYDVTKASNVMAYRTVMVPETGAILSFDYRVNGQANNDYLKVNLVKGETTTEIATLQGENDWASFSYDISGEVCIQFNWVNNATNGNQFPAAIDNISVIETPCSQPSALTATVDSTTAVISWVAAEGQTAWNFQYKLADHSEWYTVPATATTVTLNDLQGNSNYVMRVQAVCGENVSAWTTGAFAVACQTEEVTVTPTNVVIGTGTSTTSYIFPGFYGWQYSAILYDMNQAGPINSIAFYLNSASSTSGSTMTVWVKAVSSDYALASSNTFATMVDGAQQIYDGDPDFSTAGWITFPVNNFTLAEGQDLLVLVRGVGCSTSGGCSKQARYTSTSNKLWYKLQDSSDPGQSVTGTLSSYRPNITINMDVTVVTCDDQIACVAPTGLQVSDITPNSAVLTWVAGAEDQTAFIVEYMAEGATEWISVEVDDTTYTLTELAQLTNYSVKVKANCGENNWSEVLTTSFRTIGICLPVTNLETANVSNTTTLTWTAGGEETAWLVQFKPASESEDAWTSIDVSLIPMTTFGGLQGNVDYDVRVKALCDPEDAENQSEWATTSFHSGCAAFEVPFTESFAASTMPTCWENTDYSFSSYSNGYTYSYNSGAELITPAINIPAENPTYLSFEVRGAGEYTVLASYRGTRADRFAEIYSGTAPNQNTTVTIALDDLYKGRAVNFKVVNNSTSYQYFYHLTVNQCPFEATALNTSNVTGTTVDLAWEADEAAANFQVQYGEQGFTVGEGTTVDVTDTTAVTISELSYETAYDFYVRVVCEGDNGAWAGPVSATTAPACSDPMNLSFDFTDAQLHWNNGEWGTPVQYNVRYKVEGAEEYTTDVVTPAAMPGYTPYYTISGLQSNTTYEMGVQSVCGENMESNWVTIMVTTPCMPLTEIPYTQDFEGDVFPPECWSQEYVSGTQDWEAATNTTYGSGSTDASFEYDNGYNTTMLVTPAFDLSSASNLILSFRHSQAEWYGDQDELRVYYRTSLNGDWVLLQAYTNNISSMTLEEIDIPAAALSSSCQFAFEGTLNYGWGIFLDDVTIKPAPTCGIPTISVSGVTATITPSEVGTPASYELMIGEQTATVTETTVDLSTVFTLEGSTTYQVSVRANCGNEDYSDWSDAVSFTTPCMPIALPYVEDFNAYTTNATSSSAPTGYPNHTMPMCWNFLNMSTSTSEYPQMFLSSHSSYAVSGNCLFFKSSSSTPAYAVLPKIFKTWWLVSLIEMKVLVLIMVQCIQVI